MKKKQKLKKKQRIVKGKTMAASVTSRLPAVRAKVELPAFKVWMRDQEITRTVRATINPDLNDAQMFLYFYECQRRNVHPLDRLIHPVMMDGRLTFQSSIDYLRSVAESTGEYLGSSAPEYFNNKEGKLEKALVKVYRLKSGQKIEQVGEVYWKEMVRTKKDGTVFSNWVKMPHLMIGKCAEAQGLRKAFPARLGGLYIQEELEAENSKPPRDAKAETSPAKQPEQPRISEETSKLVLAKIEDISKRTGKTVAEIRNFAREKLIGLGFARLAESSEEAAIKLLNTLEETYGAEKTKARN